MKPIEVYLDFIAKDMVTINCTQYDVDARTLTIHLLDNGKIFNLDETIHSLLFKMSKKDGTKILNECTINSDGTASYLLTEQCCLFSGIFDIQFMLVNPTDKSILHTMPARLNVTKSVADNVEIESSNEFNLLNKLLLEIDGIKDNFLTIQQDVISNENIRKSNEETRNNNEIVRKSNEDIRKSNEDTRTSNENIRLNAETNRINAENTRTQSEINRESAEIIRVYNESDRVEAERLRAESFADIQANIANYYRKNETYSQEEVNELISTIPKFEIDVVDTLPTSNISATTVYLVKGSTSENNLYTEYIYVNNSWEILGVANINLDLYYSKDETDELLFDVENRTAENLFDINKRFNRTGNGVTASVSESNNGLLNGTSTGSASVLTYDTNSLIDISDLEVGESITLSMQAISGSYTSNNTISSRLYADVRTKDNVTLSQYKITPIMIFDNTSGSKTFTMTQEIKDAGAYYLYPQIWVYKGDVFDNYEVQIMVEKGSVAHNYVPYNLSKKSLREDITNIEENITNIEENITDIQRNAVVGQSGVADTTKPWYKFASVSTTDKNNDMNISFKVYTGFGDKSTKLGILTTHIRTNASANFDSAELVWEYAVSGINPNDFALAYKDGTNSTDVELWVKCTPNYQFYHFVVISEGWRGDCANNIFTLYNTQTIGSQESITSGYTQIVSTLAVLKNASMEFTYEEEYEIGRSYKEPTAQSIGGDVNYYLLKYENGIQVLAANLVMQSETEYIYFPNAFINDLYAVSLTNNTDVYMWDFTVKEQSAGHLAIHIEDGYVFPEGENTNFVSIICIGRWK